jgi:segregation and condensation protein A
VFPAEAKRPEYTREKAQPDVDMRELLLALKEVMHRADMFESHQISREKLSTRERMANVLDKLKGREFVPFIELFNPEEGKLGVVVTFLATLELVKGALIELVQTESFAPIHVKAKTLVLEESDLLAGLELEDEPDAHERHIGSLDDANDDTHDGTKG